MSGRDVPTRQKTLSVAFSVIMVLSMVAVGMAGFAGSAAALEDPKTDDSDRPISGAAGGFVVADSADPGANDSVHNVTVEVSDGDLASNNIRNITVDYGTNVFQDIDNTADLSSNNDLVLKVDGTVIENVGGTADETLTVNDDSITIGNLGGAAQGLSDGSVVSLRIGGANGVNNPAEGTYDITTDVGDDAGNQNSTTSTLELPGAVGVYENADQSNANHTFTTINDAVTNATTDNSWEKISVDEGEYREFGDAITIDTITDTDGLVFEGSNAVINTSADAQLTIGNNQNVTVDGFTFEGNDNVQQAIDGTGTDDNLTISNNDFQNYAGTNPVVNVNAPDVTIDTNTFTGVAGDDAVNVAGGDVTFDSLTVEDSSSANAVDVQGGTVDLANLDIDNIATGVNFGTVTDYNISSSTFTNVSGTAVSVGDATSNQANLDEVTVDDSSGATGIDLSPGVATNVTVDSADINDTDVGINIGSTDTSTDSDTAILNSEVSNSNNATDISDLGALQSGGSGTATVTMEDNVFSNNDDGLFVDGDASDEVNLNVHFNEFSSNVNGTHVDSSFNNAILNVTFNDYVDNEQNGLLVGAIAGGSVNANYSWWDNRDSSRIVGPYTPQNAGSQLPIPRRVYSYTRLHTGGQP